MNAGAGRITIGSMNAHPHIATDLGSVIRRQVPRYTSYPTAPHFTTDVGPEAYEDWLRRAGASGLPVSLYLHVPYCRSICHYCGCSTKASRKDGPVRAYVEVLRREIAMVAERLGPVAVSHVHWGGGTPNLLGHADFETLVGDLHAHFDLSAVVEHAIELDPREMGPDDARFLARMGVNRASLGVQDLDSTVQEAIGRHQPLELVEAAVSQLHRAGIGAINMDLIYGLPFQTHQTIRRTAMHVAGLAPSRISLFGYAHVPWFRPNQRLIDEASLPGGDLRLALSRTARETIDAFGYEAIGIDHFARPEDPLTLARDARTLHRNFQGYTTDDAQILVGFGSSSIGRTPWGYVQNAVANGVWRRAIEQDRLPVERGRAYAGEDLLRAAVIEELLCFFDVDLAAVAARHGADPAVLAGGIDTLRPLIAAGWVEVDGWRVAIRTHGPEIARVVASAFDAYLGTGGRHSVAV
ncbi:oxygen-independent coproporphyrinogen-II Ioxidase [Pleomorphomonas sp. SM30]|uniref:Coproporphyrinogen-III oxidase n=2 Tax=Oharaeibacter diazotrophicus TaxID=1920512 RepID=A0A4R6RFV2_9HYPH|nr:oxygen-independent coproporphyrinogen-3 oxidase [Oharaeibacter diazotrophicus]BBE74163.1 oxygen-independent coproporphyrinogen-II Ioxidase [Pleomorphomonas sp. SM30]